MLVRMFCRNHCGSMDNDAEPMDAFWVEASQREAEKSVYPMLSQAEVSKSRQLVKEFSHVAGFLGNPDQPYCFLVTRDLASIEPFPSHHPVHNLWNGYSPFKSMPRKVVENLAELRDIELPPASQADADSNT